MEFRSNLEKKLCNNEFVITCEVFPPKGTDISPLIEKVNIIRDYVDAINVTDCQRAVMRISSKSVSSKLVDLGVEPVMQLTCRDRNRLALQSDILGAHILGIKNILLMSGDYPSIGDNKYAKPVYDLDSTQLISMTRNFNNGYDLEGRKLQGNTNFYIGATLNPNSTPHCLPILAMEKKIEAGAAFFQTQPIFNINSFLEFKKHIQKTINTKIILGVFLLKSVSFAERISNIPGVNLPMNILNRLKDSDDELTEGIKIAAELVHSARKYVDGVHIMAIGKEEYIPEIIKLSNKY